MKASAKENIKSKLVLAGSYQIKRFLFVCLPLLLYSLQAWANESDSRLIIAIQAEGLSLDPHRAADAGSMRLIENMHCGLLRYSETYGEFELDLAKSLEISKNGLVYDFQIKQNAYFHSGRPVTADAVKASLLRIQNSQIRSNHFALVKAIEVIDPYQLRIHLKEAFSPFPLLLAHPMNAILDAEALQGKNAFDPYHAPCGPYQLVSWEQNFRLIMKKFAKSFRAHKIASEYLEYRPIPDESSRTTALRTGEVDIVFDLPLKDIDKIIADKQLAIQSIPGTFWEYLAMQTNTPPFNQQKVRQAVAWALDRKQLNRLVKFGHAELLKAGPIPSTHWASLQEPVYPSRNLALARELLAQAGYADGFTTTLLVGSQFPYQVDAAVVIKQQLRDVGIRVKIQSLESNLFFHRLNQQNFAMAIVGWLGFVDPDEWFYEIFRSDGQWNQQAYQNPEVDDLIKLARQITERDRRREIYSQLQKIIARDAPMAFLYNNQQIAAHHRNVVSFRIHPTGVGLALQEAYRQDRGLNK